MTEDQRLNYVDYFLYDCLRNRSLGETGELDERPAIDEHDVLGFDVTMDHADGMGVAQCFEHRRMIERARFGSINPSSIRPRTETPRTRSVTRNNVPSSKRPWSRTSTMLRWSNMLIAFASRTNLLAICLSAPSAGSSTFMAARLPAQILDLVDGAHAAAPEPSVYAIVLSNDLAQDSCRVVRGGFGEKSH